jgi:hypothetical protein
MSARLPPKLPIAERTALNTTTSRLLIAVSPAGKITRAVRCPPRAPKPNSKPE